MLRAAHVLVFVGALFIVATGLFGGLVGIATSFIVPGADQLAMVTFGLSFLSLAVGLGSLLAWQAWQASQGQESPPFQPRRAGPLGIFLLVATIFLGHTVLDQEMLAPLAFPPFHVVAAFLPSLIILALVGRALGLATLRRDLVLQLSSGAFLSTTLAFSLELLVILSLLVLGVVIVAAQPDGLERIQELAVRLQDPTWLQDPDSLAPFLRSPFILIPALLVFAILVPMIEEAVKTVGVGLMGYRRPTLGQAFLWGLAGGAGFALVEALFNSMTGLDSWASVMSLRIGATLLHCFTGALMGLAWYAILIQRRWGRALAIYAGCVGVHGIWNAVAAGMTFIALQSSGVEPDALGQFEAGPGDSVLLMLILIMTVLVALGLGGLTWYVRERSQDGDDPEGQARALPAEGPHTGGPPAETP